MSSIAGPAFADTQIVQAKNGTTTDFRFSEDELKFTLSDKTSSTTFKTPYTQLDREHGYFVERNTWLMNVGWLWLALGVGVTAMSFFATTPHTLKPSYWLFLGAGCAAFAWLRTVRYTKVQTESGALLVIDDAQKPRILAELDSRRLEQLRRWHDFVDADADPQAQRSRFQWIHREGALDEAELADRLDQLARLPEAGFGGRPVATEPEPPSSNKLN